MIISIQKRRADLSHKILSTFTAFTFIFSLVLPPGYAQLLPASPAGGPQTILNLPAPGSMVSVTPGFTPPIIKGITIHPENPFEFDFIIGTGDERLKGEAFKTESKKMIKYFLATLTVPEEELWVNLSPYEKDRIIPQGFGDTEMGRDLLAQDYLLKQLTASMMYPEQELGQEFWNKVYQKAREKFGTTEIPLNTFNKVWIVPDEALVYEQGSSAFVIKSRLRVMLEQDYVTMQHNLAETPASLSALGGQQGLEEDYLAMSHHVTKSQSHQETMGDLVSGDLVTSRVIKEIIIPEIEKEVNEGKTFANLRQIYNSVILAAWYKENLKESLLGQIYVDKTKTLGVDTQDKKINQKIYNQYLEAFKKGVYNYIREDYDPATQRTIPRKYFSGGLNLELTKATSMDTKPVLRSVSEGQPFSALDKGAFAAYTKAEKGAENELVNTQLAGVREDNVGEVVDVTQKWETQQEAALALAASPVVKTGLSEAIGVAAQRITSAAKANTGELNVDAAVRAGANGVLAGHSEARSNLGDTDEMVNEQLRAAHGRDLDHILFAFGEKIEVREKGREKEFVETQIKKGLVGFAADQAAKTIFAYEPIWAIGTGKTATPQQAQGMARFVRDTVASLYSQEVADKIIILYGGSVTPETAAELIAQEDIDGFLVGGASNEYDSFTSIIKTVETHGPAKGRIPYVGGNHKTKKIKTGYYSDLSKFFKALDTSRIRVSVLPSVGLITEAAHAMASSPMEITGYAAVAKIAKKYSLEGLGSDNFVFVYKDHADFLEELIKKGYGEVKIWNVKERGYYPNVNESTPNELLPQVMGYSPGMIIISKNSLFNKYDLPTTKEIMYQIASQLGEVDKKTGEVEFHSEDVIAKIARLLSANGFGDEVIRDEYGKEIAPTKVIDPFFDDEYQSDEYITQHTTYRKYTIDRYDLLRGGYGASGIILIFKKDGSIRQYYKISDGAQPQETNFPPASSPVSGAEQYRDRLVTKLKEIDFFAKYRKNWDTIFREFNNSDYYLKLPTRKARFDEAQRRLEEPLKERERLVTVAVKDVVEEGNIVGVVVSMGDGKSGELVRSFDYITTLAPQALDQEKGEINRAIKEGKDIYYSQRLKKFYPIFHITIYAEGETVMLAASSPVVDGADLERLNDFIPSEIRNRDFTNSVGLTWDEFQGLRPSVEEIDAFKALLDLENVRLEMNDPERGNTAKTKLGEMRFSIYHHLRGDRGELVKMWLAIKSFAKAGREHNINPRDVTVLSLLYDILSFNNFLSMDARNAIEFLEILTESDLVRDYRTVKGLFDDYRGTGLGPTQIASSPVNKEIKSRLEQILLSIDTPLLRDDLHKSSTGSEVVTIIDKAIVILSDRTKKDRKEMDRLFDSEVARETYELTRPGMGPGMFVSEKTSRYLRLRDAEGEKKDLLFELDALKGKIIKAGLPISQSSSPVVSDQSGITRRDFFKFAAGAVTIAALGGGLYALTKSGESKRVMKLEESLKPTLREMLERNLGYTIIAYPHFNSVIDLLWEEIAKNSHAFPTFFKIYSKRIDYGERPIMVVRMLGGAIESRGELKWHEELLSARKISLDDLHERAQAINKRLSIDQSVEKERQKVIKVISETLGKYYGNNLQKYGPVDQLSNLIVDKIIQSPQLVAAIVEESGSDVFYIVSLTSKGVIVEEIMEKPLMLDGFIILQNLKDQLKSTSFPLSSDGKAPVSSPVADLPEDMPDNYRTSVKGLEESGFTYVGVKEGIYTWHSPLPDNPFTIQYNTAEKELRVVIKRKAGEEYELAFWEKKPWTNNLGGDKTGQGFIMDGGDETIFDSLRAEIRYIPKDQRLQIIIDKMLEDLEMMGRPRSETIGGGKASYEFISRSSRPEELRIVGGEIEQVLRWPDKEKYRAPEGKVEWLEDQIKNIDNEIDRAMGIDRELKTAKERKHFNEQLRRLWELKKRLQSLLTEARTRVNLIRRTWEAGNDAYNRAQEPRLRRGLKPWDNWIYSLSIEERASYEENMKAVEHFREEVEYFREEFSKWWKKEEDSLFKSSSPMIDSDRLSVVSGQQLSSDQRPATSGRFRKGGIDLNPMLMDMKIKRDGNGIPLPLPMQPAENLKIDGFVPVIINVTPFPSLPMLLGLADTDTVPDTDQANPALKAREPEEVSLLN